MSNEWQERAQAAHARHERLMSFGSYARAVLASTAHGLFVVDPEDSGVSASLLQHGRYGDEELRVAMSLVSKNSDVLVVGTHIGALAVPLSRCCKMLVGIEANPRSFELLAANVRLNGADNVRLHNVAAGQHDGRQVEFVLNRDNSGGSKIKPVHNGDAYTYDSPEIIAVTTVKLDTLLAGRSFDLIIMDIEGSETFALAGMSDVLAASRTLAVEFRPHHLIEVAGVTIDAFIATVAPFFKILYVPGRSTVYKDADVAEALRVMFAADECHDAIYLSKEESALATISH